MLLAALAVLLAACGGDDEAATPGAGDGAATATPTGEAAPTEAASVPDDGDPATLTVLTHGSFDAEEDVIAAFEEEHNATVEFIAAGDANEVVNRAILNAGNPEADVLFGVDNLTAARALEADVFTAYVAERRDEIPADVLAAFGDSEALTPIDYGYVALNFDRSAGEPPSTLREVAEPEWASRLVVQDPATSSPGLQFLATTVAHFGEEGEYTWRDFWADLRAGGVLVTDGWEEAYNTAFSLYGGDRPLVVSYTTSPAAEVFFGDLEEPPTVNVIPEGSLFRQVEAAGVLRGSEQEELAGAFIDFMLSDAFQAQIPATMFVYPVIPGTPTPEWWRWAEVEVEPATLEADAETIDRWIEEWTEIMRR